MAASVSECLSDGVRRCQTAIPSIDVASIYDGNYKRERRVLLAQRVPCQLRLVCGGAVADSADHDPPIRQHRHVPGSGCCRLVPACVACQHKQGGLIRSGRLKARAIPAPSRVW